MGFIPLYSWFASRVDRVRLIVGVTLFFIVNLELFWLALQVGVPYLGVAFFIWVGIFNNAIVAQFWSYGNDLYRQRQAQRLFPVIGIGVTLGAPLGAALAGRLFKLGVSAYSHAARHRGDAGSSRWRSTPWWKRREERRRPPGARWRGSRRGRAASRCSCRAPTCG